MRHAKRGLDCDLGSRCCTSSLAGEETGLGTMHVLVLLALLLCALRALAVLRQQRSLLVRLGADVGHCSSDPRIFEFRPETLNMSTFLHKTLKS